MGPRSSKVAGSRSRIQLPIMVAGLAAQVGAFPRDKGASVRVRGLRRFGDSASGASTLERPVHLVFRYAWSGNVNECRC